MNYDSLARGQPHGRVRTASAAERSIAFSPSMLSNLNRGWKTHAPVSHMARHILCDQAPRRLLQACPSSHVAREGACGDRAPEGARADETSSWLMKTSRQANARADDPACTNSCLRLKRKR